jgi:hypothetical protein
MNDGSIMTLPALAVKAEAGVNCHIWRVTLSTSDRRRPVRQAYCVLGAVAWMVQQAGGRLDGDAETDLKGPWPASASFATMTSVGGSSTSSATTPHPGVPGQPLM